VSEAMNYIDALARRIYDHGKPTNPPDESDMRLYRIYAVLALAKGKDTTLEDVHDAWSAWQADMMPDHRSLIPFAELSPQVQAYDQEYCDAIHACSSSVTEANV
jgi:hypothetical protein